MRKSRGEWVRRNSLRFAICDCYLSFMLGVLTGQERSGTALSAAPSRLALSIYAAVDFRS